MIDSLIGAFALGVVAGLRTFTAPAAYWLSRGPMLAGGILAIAAIGELIGDLMPWIPSRTSPPGVAARLVSGSVVGWFFAGSVEGAPVAGAIAGAVGALAGTYGGHAARIAGIVRIGAIPAALVEDVVAVGLAAVVVTSVRG